MPDLTTEYAWRCSSTENWTKVVSGSKGSVYTVSWNNWQHQNPDVQYDYACTCKAFKYGKGKPCKHIEAVKLGGHHCRWDNRFTGEEPTKSLECPCCGNRAISYRYGA